MEIIVDGEFLAHFVPRSPHAQYISHGMIELLRTSIDVVEGSSYLGINIDDACENETQQILCNNPDKLFEPWQHEDLNSLESRLEREYVARLATANNFQKKAIAEHIRKLMPEQMIFFRENLAGLLTDSILRANNIQHNNSHYSAVLFDAEKSPFDVKRISLITPELVKDLVNRNSILCWWKQAFQRSVKRMNMFIDVMPDEEFRSLHDAYRAEAQRMIDESIKRYRNRIAESPTDENGACECPPWDDFPMENPETPKRKLSKRERNRERKVLKRSMKIYEKFRGSSEIRTFVSGETITINGTLYDYVVQKKKRANLLQHSGKPNTHTIPYDLTLRSKDGTKLAQGCVYFPETPVIDQVLALSFHVQQKENELLILEKTNWYNRTDAFKEDQLITSLKPTYDPTLADADDNCCDNTAPLGYLFDKKFEIIRWKIREKLKRHPLMNQFVIAALESDNDVVENFLNYTPGADLFIGGMLAV